MADTLFPDPSPEPRADRRHARRRRGGRTALVVLVSLDAVLGLAGVGGAGWVARPRDGNIEKLADPFEGLENRPDPAPSDPEGASEAVTVLVLGYDSRIAGGGPSQWEAGAQRTDAIMLVHLPADRQTAQVVSIPRDAWVPIPGHGEAKINAAFSYGGPPLMIQTVEDLTGVRIDHFAVTDFESFTTLTDALGGVQIRIPEDIGDGKKVFFEAGVHQMTGEEALTYTRQRHGLANGDFGRVQRQQNWMRAMLGKINNNRNDVAMMTRFFTAVSESVATDDGLTIDEMRNLYMSARGLSTNDVTFMTAPNSGTGRSADGQSIVVLDRARFDPLMASIANDSVGDYLVQNAEALEVLPPTVK